ncbi:MAG TPA: aminopeptidase [Clostridiaceae bacterium]|nr:aminopeptidase [Clostridiaceae bacterium]
MENLERKTELAWDKYNEEDMKIVFNFADDYREFMSKVKTERECAIEIVRLAKSAGFRDLNEIIKNNEKLKAGDKVFSNSRDKALILYVIGEEDIENGLAILGAHIDSPRLDLKQNPLYEDSDLALLKTHYYGGIKKYQWVSIPLAMHGVIILENGQKIEVSIGEDDNDPVIGISDLLPHLAKDQMKKAMDEGIEGEDLNILAGSIPVKDKDAKERVKKNILKLLNEKYNICEEDLVSAELEIVPAGKARDYGLDRSMIMAYGHDDRVCSYTSFRAIAELDNSQKTLACILVDKEEIGSVGASGMHSKFFENTLAEIISLKEGYSDIKLRRCLTGSKMLSSDVSAAHDPNYPSVSDKMNTAYLGKGIAFNKYTGSRGKGGCNDANPEFIAEIRRVMNKNGVTWQTAELGKVDQGGGGTIAYIMANYNMDVIDCGVAVQNMHAPWEVISKADLYETYRAYNCFLREI